MRSLEGSPRVEYEGLGSILATRKGNQSRRHYNSWSVWLCASEAYRDIVQHFQNTMNPSPLNWVAKDLS